MYVQEIFMINNSEDKYNNHHPEINHAIIFYTKINFPLHLSNKHLFSTYKVSDTVNK